METRVTDQAVFILRRRDWRNSSLMLDLFTCEFGRLRAIARGAKRSPARASYRPFELLSVSWSGRQELKTLTAIEGHALAVDERNYLALLYVNDLIGAILPERDASPEIFAGYLSLLQDAAGPLGEARLRRFELELLRLLGYIPDFTTDARDGQPIRPDRHYQFVIGNGFVACAASDPNSVGGSTVIDWNEGRYRHDPVLRLAKSVLRSTIDFNLHGKKLKSRDVYQEMAKRK